MFDTSGYQIRMERIIALYDIAEELESIALEFNTLSERSKQWESKNLFVTESASRMLSNAIRGANFLKEYVEEGGIESSFEWVDSAYHRDGLVQTMGSTVDEKIERLKWFALEMRPFNENYRRMLDSCGHRSKDRSSVESLLHTSKYDLELRRFIDSMPRCYV
jgi:hypothetical protein